MSTRLVRFLFIAVAVLNGPTKGHSQSSSPILVTTPLIREEQKMLVNAIPEVWRLEWKSSPKPACGPEDASSAMTCPCNGFAYGEAGELDLVRTENGREVERLALTPLFEKVFADQEFAIVQRWEPLEKDFEEYTTEGFAVRVRTRPIVKIMQFADYNHDGWSMEFFLQTGVEPCGKRTGIVVGLTRRNPQLHAFGTILHPDKPLVMQKRHWEALVKATGSMLVLDWPCGDHGSEIESELELSVTDGGIQAIRREFQCTETGNRGRLLRKEPF